MTESAEQKKYVAKVKNPPAQSNDPEDFEQDPAII